MSVPALVRVQLPETILELVEANIGVTVLARWAVAPQAARRRIAMVSLGRSGGHRRWHAVDLRQSAAAAAHVKAFASLLTHGPPTLDHARAAHMPPLARPVRAASER
ncbi:MAG: LysR substrate-binding domain-containing protein [Gemmatimonadota bacterium]